MKYPIYTPEAHCPKCGFPTTQMFTAYCKKEHEIVVDKIVKKCKIKDEHLHYICSCGYDELVFRPMDWKEPVKKVVKKKTVSKSGLKTISKKGNKTK